MHLYVGMSWSGHNIAWCPSSDQEQLFDCSELGKHWLLHLYLTMSVSTGRVCSGRDNYQYKLLCTISNNIEVYEKPVPRAKRIFHYVVEFEAIEKNRIVYERL